LTPLERAALKEAIRQACAILVPVVIDEFGCLIDGHYRVELWHELRAEGVNLPDYPRDIRPGLTDAQKRILARYLNLARRQVNGEGRQMGRAERRQLIAGQVRDEPGQSDRQIAAVLGCDHKTVGSVRQELERTGEIPQLVRTVGADGKSRPSRRPSVFARDGREAKRARAALEALTPEDLPDRVMDVRRLEHFALKKRWQVNKNRVPDASFNMGNVDLRVGDCEEVLADVTPNSVDLILSDPPYDYEGVYRLRAYDKLGRLAARLLHPEGLMLTYAGTMYLPEAIADLKTHVDYRWTLPLIHKGRRQSVQDRQVHNGWKPIVAWAKKGSGRGLNWILDVIQQNEGAEKEYHAWQQGVAEAVALIKQLTKPGDLVCDPFMGSGTVAVAAAQAGRRFVGCDIESGWVATAQKRLAELKPEQVEEARRAD
jgi:hypothetical protein